MPLQFKPGFLKCAFYWYLYSTFLSLTIKALYLSANEFFHAKIKEAAVIICLALKLIPQHTIVHQRDGNYFHGHEFIRGGRKYRKLTIVSLERSRSIWAAKVESLFFSVATDLDLLELMMIKLVFLTNGDDGA